MKYGTVAAFLAALLFSEPSAIGQQTQSPPGRDLSELTSGAASMTDLGSLRREGALSARVGTGSLMTFPADVERVALADDTIARVQIVSPREVLLTGLVPGRTTVHVWLKDGERLQYVFRVLRDLDLLQRVMKDLEPRIEVESANDGTAVILRGTVEDESIALEAIRRAEAILGASSGGRAQVLSLLRYQGSIASTEELLEETLSTVDPRIAVTRIQVGDRPDASRDTFVLEGMVETVEALKRAVLLAERQLGGTGGRVRALEDERVRSGRNRDSFGIQFTTGGTGTAGSGQNGLALRGTDPRSSSLSSQIARGLVITSESGRVVSLLEVEYLPQVMVSIRVLEIDRAKARRVGFDFRITTEHLQLGSLTLPNDNAGSTTSLDGVPGVNTAASIVGTFVDQTSEILTAIDFMTEKNLARAVAEPNVVTLSGELASILVGGEVPIPTSTANQVATFSGVFFQDFGVRLDIRPTATESGLIALEVAPSIVRVAPGLAVGGVPGFQVQSVNTTARVRAGQSLLIGGLLSFEDGVELRKLPGIGAIPLFRWKRRSRQERELMFLITPRIVDSEAAPQIDPTVEPPDPREITLPELDWPEHRQRYLEAEPEYLRPDGVAPEFVPLEYGEGYRWKEYDWEDEGWEETDYQTTVEAEPVTFTLEPTDEPAAEPEPSEGLVLEPMAEKGEAEVEPEPVAAQEIEAVELPPVMVVDAEPCLRLRSEPGPWSNPITCVDRFTRVEVLGTEGGWSYVRLADGSEGWMASGYLVPAEPGGAERTDDASPAAVEPEPEDELSLQIARAENGQGELEDRLEKIRAELESMRAADGGSE